MNRIRVLEMEIRNQPSATPLLHIPNGVPEIAPASMPQRKRKTATVAGTAAVAATPEVDDAEEETPIATSRPKRHSAPLKGTTNGDTVQEEDTPTRPSKRAKIKVGVAAFVRITRGFLFFKFVVRTSFLGLRIRVINTFCL